MYKQFLTCDGSKFSNQKIRFICEETKQQIIEQTFEFPDDTPILVRLVSLRDHNGAVPVCGYCKAPQTTLYNGKFKRFCNSKCYAKTPEFKMNLQKVNHEQANEKRKQSMSSKYGVEFNSQRPEVKLILSQSKLVNINNTALDILQSKECLENLHINQKMSSLKISEKLGIYYGTVQDWLKKHNIEYHYYNHESQYEKWVQNWLDDNHIEYSINDRTVLAPKELDIWIPSKHCAIEINGYYWHGAKKKEDLTDAQNKHKNKSTECRELGISLINLTDLDIKYRPEKIKQFLKSKLVDKQKISARKCKIDIISTCKAKSFCEKYHLQGYSGSSIKLGLYYDDEICAVMTFSKSRFNQSCWEIVRSCSNIRVVGGVSKLITFFINNQMKSGEKLISYVNLSYGFNGISYEKSGMILSNITTPGYIWIGKNEQIFSRYQMQKHCIKKYFPDYLDEEEDAFLFNKGLIKLYDSGNLIYSFTKD